MVVIAEPSNVAISARRISKAFGGQVVLKGVSCDLKRGEIILLRGQNGSGKTTLLNILTGNLEPDSGELYISIGTLSESFRWPRKWWQNLNPFDHFTPEKIARNGVGRVWQDLRLFSSMTILDNVVVAIPNQSGENPIVALLRLGQVKKEEIYNREQANKWLSRFDLGERAFSSCDKISLGQMKRVAILRAVQAGAKILFLDEPLSGLDARGVLDVMHFLADLAQVHSLAIVIVEHVFNAQQVLKIATGVWTLDSGCLSVDSTHPSCASKGELQEPVNWLREVGGGEGTIETYEFKEMAKISTVIPRGRENQPEVLQVKDLVVRRGHRTVLDRFSLSLRRGQLTLIEAPNGWGKSTLLDAIAGLMPVQSGDVILNGRIITPMPTDKRILNGMGYLRPCESMFGSLSGAEHWKLSRGHVFGFDEGSRNNSTKANKLSGGLKQRLCIEMIPPSEVYLLDELFLGLDDNAVSLVLRDLCRLIRDGASILVAMPRG